MSSINFYSLIGAGGKQVRERSSSASSFSL